jgi:Regulator of ribonuclease activity B
VTWWILLILAAAAVAAIRVFVILKRQRALRQPSWDEKLVRRLRDQGFDAFSKHDLDFFFHVPDAAVAQAIAQILEREGFRTDTHTIADDERRLSLHASKAFRLSPEELTQQSKRFSALAAEHGARYDGWMIAHGAPRHGV